LPGIAADADGLCLSCGSVLDYRPAERLLQSHADLWLTPLSGVDPKKLAGAWPDVLEGTAVAPPGTALRSIRRTRAAHAAQGVLHGQQDGLGRAATGPVSPPPDVLPTLGRLRGQQGRPVANPPRLRGFDHDGHPPLASAHLRRLAHRG
jgi:hypothetical protein